MLRQAEPCSTQPALLCLSRFSTWCVTGAVCVMLLGLSGCSRSFWRQNADKNSYAILQDKSADPRWAPNRLDVTADQRSRFFDPYDPDFEPLPPDDPTAHGYMHWMGRNTGVAKVDQAWTGGVIPPWLYPQKPIRGWKSWHKFGDTFTVENPQWLEPFGLTPEQLAEQRNAGLKEGPGVAEMTLPQAMELAYINSREYQTALEQVYLDALSLTLQRFQFDVRYLGLGGQKPSASLTDTQGSNNHTLLGNARAGVSQLLPGGGQFIVELANNTLWLFTGGNQSSTASVLSYSIVQPLLLGAGRQVVLESLTQAERNSLYSIRTFARFRQSFFTNVTSSYLQLLTSYQGIRNSRYNILLLNKQLVRMRYLAKELPKELKVLLPREYAGNGDAAKALRLKQFKADVPDFPPSLSEKLRYDLAANSLIQMDSSNPLTEADLLELQKFTSDPGLQRAAAELLTFGEASKNALNLQLSQLESTMLQNRTQLMTSERSLQDALDTYKLLMGLPPDLWLTLNLKLLDPFELISPKLLDLEEEITNFVDKTSVVEGNDLVSKELQSLTDQMLVLGKRLKTDALALVQEDLKRVQDNTPNRLAKLPPFFDDQYRKSILIDYERDQRLIAIIRLGIDNEIRELEELKELLEQRAKNLPAPAAVAPGDVRSDPLKALATHREQMVKFVQSLEVVQINLRVELIDLNTFSVPLEEAVQSGLENRVDLMNQRAFVMDARRKVEVIANSLRSQVNVTVAGDIRTVPIGAGSTAPFEFRGDQSSYRMGLNFVAPLDQVAQRNNYRAALVSYQQARRAYMAAEDAVKFNIRSAWRQLNVIRTQFELTRKSVRINAMQYDQAVEAAVQPAGLNANTNSSNNNTGLNIIKALGDVLSAQNSLISSWASYEINRLNIHRDMGIMQLDERGVWIDEYYYSQFGPGSSTLPADPEIDVPAISPVDSLTSPPLLSPADAVPPDVPANPE